MPNAPKRDERLIHALKRNGVGARVLVALRAAGPATMGDLSRSIGSRHDNVRNAIRGRYPRVKLEHALLSLGLVRARRGAGPVRYELTPLGAKWALRIERGLHREEQVVRTFRLAARG